VDLPIKRINRHLSVEQAEQKIKHYCAYQERSHFEVREKLYTLGLHKMQVETLLTKLITENYLDEERFAASFARGKFNLKQWGRIKIKYALKLKKVSDYNIKTALKQIDEADYLTVLQKLATEKWALLKGEHYITRQAKTTAFLMQKGFEPQLAQQAVREAAGKS